MVGFFLLLPKCPLSEFSQYAYCSDCIDYVCVRLHHIDPLENFYMTLRELNDEQVDYVYLWLL